MSHRRLEELIRRSLGVVLLVGLGTSFAAEARSEGVSRRGRVVFVSSQRAYLDRGRLDGLEIGTVLHLKRGARTIGTCKVDLLADRSSACRLATARAGDSFLLAARGSAPIEQPLPPPLSVGETERQRAQLEAATYAKVDQDRPSGTGRGTPMVAVSVGEQAWATLSGGPSFEAQRVRVSLSGLPLGFGGFRAYAELEALHYSARPDQVRFRPADSTQFYAWEAELASREPGRPYALALGRVWPWHLPGLVALDGAQMGWKSEDDETEAGVYAGGLPDPATLDAALDRWTTGAYAAHTHVGSRQSFFRLARVEGRVGVRNAPGLGTMTDLEVLAAAWLGGWLDVGLEERTALATSWAGSPSIEALRAHIGATGPRLRVLGNFRYLAPKSVNYDGLGVGPFGMGGYTLGDVDVSWDHGGWLTLGATVGAENEEGGSGRDRQWIGPDIGLPRLFGSVGGFGVGYREEFGWLPGRSAYVQAALHPGERVDLFARVSYFEDRGGDVADAPAFRELGLFTSANIRILRWLSFRASVLARIGMEGFAGNTSGTPSGLMATMDLAAAL